MINLTRIPVEGTELVRVLKTDSKAEHGITIYEQPPSYQLIQHRDEIIKLPLPWVYWFEMTYYGTGHLKALAGAHAPIQNFTEENLFCLPLPNVYHYRLCMGSALRGLTIATKVSGFWNSGFNNDGIGSAVKSTFAAALGLRYHQLIDYAHISLAFIKILQAWEQINLEQVCATEFDCMNSAQWIVNARILEGCPDVRLT